MAKHLETEMDNLKGTLQSLTTMVEDIVRISVKALKNKDKALAKEVIAFDNDVDQKEVELEEDCLKILALHQPVAIDLRYIIGVLKVNNDLERIGDLAVNIAERTLFIIKNSDIDAPFDFTEMSKLTIEMLESSILALLKMDSELAKQVILNDEKVDALNREMYSKVYAMIQKTPEEAPALLNYVSISRHLERIADYTTNIAEDIIYMIDGVIVRHNPEIYDD